jgi:phosphoglycerate kinase
MSIESLSKQELSGKKVLVRVDFNVPLENGVITSDARIKASLPTIQYLVERGAVVLLATHLGRPKGQVVEELRLAPVSKRLEELLNEPVVQLSDCIGDGIRNEIESQPNCKVFVLENVRFYKEETDNDVVFSKKLASLADIFVQESFGTAHRAHASTVGVAEFLPTYAGFLVQKEIDFLSQALHNPKHPYVAIVGGSKVSTKIAVLEQLIKHVDTLVIGGAMAFTFLKALGFSVGKSLVEDDKQDLALELLHLAKTLNKKVILPVDVVVASSFSADAQTDIVSIQEIPDDKMGLDIGPDSIQEILSAISEAKMVIWNGPVGAFELAAFATGTLSIAKSLASSSAITIVGGGDSIAALEKSAVTDKISHVSTGGGACLEFLEGKVLPGLQVLQKRSYS